MAEVAKRGAVYWSLREVGFDWFGSSSFEVTIQDIWETLRVLQTVNKTVKYNEAREYSMTGCFPLEFENCRTFDFSDILGLQFLSQEACCATFAFWALTDFTCHVEVMRGFLFGAPASD